MLLLQLGDQDVKVASGYWMWHKSNTLSNEEFSFTRNLILIVYHSKQQNVRTTSARDTFPNQELYLPIRLDDYNHSDAIMSAIASQITGNLIVCLTFVQAQCKVQH